MTKKLLVADDSVTIHKVVNLTFAGEDVAIDAVSSGDQAVERARSTHPDIILADVFMPGLNGYEVCSSIKGDPELSATPVVLLVGTFEAFDEAEAARVQSDGHLTKPFDTSELIEIVRSLLERPGRTAEARVVQAVTQASTVAATAVVDDASEEPLVSARARESFLGDTRILDVFAPQLLEAMLAPPAAEAPPESPEPVTPSPVPESEVPQPQAVPEEELPAKPKLTIAPQVIPFPGTRQVDAAAEGVELPEDIVNLIVDRVVRRMSPDVIRDVAWEVIPELAEIIIRQVLNEKGIPSSPSSEEPGK